MNNKYIIENTRWILLFSNFYLFEFYHNFSHQNHLDNLHSHCNENCAEYIHQNGKRVPKLNIKEEKPFLRKIQTRINEKSTKKIVLIYSKKFGGD